MHTGLVVTDFVLVGGISMKCMRKSEIIIFGIIILSFAIGIYYYPQMPDKLASHWNVQGNVDSYMSKFWGLFFMPIISVVMLLLFILIPRINPLKSNIQQFSKYYNGFVLLIMFYILSIFIDNILEHWIYIQSNYFLISRFGCNILLFWNFNRKC